jgi:ABC-type nitrate/sulfonate/bicarbonate transport system permease component
MDWLIGSPGATLKVGYELIFGALKFPPPETSFWSHVFMSMAELILGSIIGYWLARGLAQMLKVSDVTRKHRLLILLHSGGPLAVVPVFFVHWFPEFAIPWVAVICVAGLSVYPMTCILIDFLPHGIGRSFLLANFEAYPYAFVGLFLGEALAGTKGIGFLTITIVHHLNTPNASMAVFVLAMLLFIFYGEMLRFLIGRLGTIDDKGVFEEGS